MCRKPIFGILAGFIFIAFSIFLPSLGFAAEVWTRQADMPTPRISHSSGVVDGKIYAIGGATARSPSTVATVEAYDPATNQWTTKASMSTGRYDLSTSVLDGKIYAIGGFPNGPPTRLVEAYDPLTDTWTRKADLLTARGFLQSGVVDGRIYTIGGGDSSIVEVYDPGTDTWSRGTNMPTPRHPEISVVDGKIYAMGGLGLPPWPALAVVEEYDPATDTWTRKTDMPTPRKGFSTIVVDGRIYAIGGVSDIGWRAPVLDVDVYDPATDTWTAAPSLTMPRFELSASVVDETIYIMGGYQISQTGAWLVNESVEAYRPELAPIARTPEPADGTTDVYAKPILQWTPGKFARRHDVYFGAHFDDVNDAGNTDPAGPDWVYRGRQDGSSYAVPESLDLEQTYYWRIDEVNSPPDATVIQGNVWSFTTEPFSIPVTNVSATASGSLDVSTAENTVNGSGLVDDLHGSFAPDMWISDGIPATIEYAFDRAYKLHELWIWNSNQLVESFLGFGAKDVVIEHSLDGENWTVLDGVGPLAQAPGTAGYAHNNTIDFGGATAQYVRLTVNSVQGIAPQASLSEVRFFAIPTYPRRPQPADGSSTNSVDVTLQWRPGREAVSHEVLLSSDPTAVEDGSAVVAIVNENSYSPDPLIYGTTYTWQINEINEAETPSTTLGDPWTFTTPQFAVVDDMEAYRDKEFLEIWTVWIDGLNDTANGSVVGNGDTGAPETGMVHGGEQSLPIHFDNSTAAVSQVTRTFDQPQDWTRSGIGTLVLYFQGSALNTGGNLYVRINDTKIPYAGDSSHLQRLGWNRWDIPLAELGETDLMRVRSLTIGIDGGGSGVIYVDDILLTSGGRELITPVEPVDGLVVYYPFDGDFRDASGHGLHGSRLGARSRGSNFEAGRSGQALRLEGSSQYVEITGYKGITAVNGVQQPFTISNWFKTLENGEMVTWGSSPGGQRLSWRIDEGSLRTEHGNGNLRGNTVANDGEWHHGALVVNEGANLRVPNTLLYIDGLEDSVFSGDDDPYNLQPNTDVSIGRRAIDNDRFFPGSIDEVRIYDRALSAAEVAWLAGRTAPFDKP